MKTYIDCEVVLDLLPLYYDNVVSDKTKEVISEHLKECASCEKEYQLISKNLPIEDTIDTKDIFIQMIKKQRYKNFLIGSVVFVVIFSVWFFSHSLTAIQALKGAQFQYTEIVAQYTENGDEIFFLKNDSQFSSNIIQKSGLFYNSKALSSYHSLEKDPNLRANFSISYDENTGITATMVIAWEDVEYVKFNDEFLKKTEYDDYTLFYGYSLNNVTEHPILYDENFNILDYYNSEDN